MKENGKEPIRRLGKISEQVLSGIVQSIETGVVLHDRNLEVVFVNDSFERIFEIPAEDVIGRSPMQFLPEFDRRHKEAIHSRLKETLETGVKSHYHEFHYCTPKGNLRTLLAISIPITDLNGGISHVMSVIHDITLRKKLEEEAVKSAKLSSIAEMAYTLAHEINNPLTGIKLGLSTLSKSLQKKENFQIIESIKQDLNRIQNTVCAFLKARRKPVELIEAGLPVVEEIIDEALFNLSGQLDLKKIRVIKQFRDEDVSINIDRDGIYRVFLNVLLNAIQAIRQQGKISISTEIITPSKKNTDVEPFLNICIHDTGRGIDAGKIDRVFKPFYSSKQGGTGLGLSICKEIVSAHKGSIEFQSEKNEGTTVRICLPISKPIEA